MIKATVVIMKFVIPIYTCRSFKIGKAKQNVVQLNAFVIAAVAAVNFEPPLSMLQS